MSAGKARIPASKFDTLQHLYLHVDRVSIQVKNLIFMDLQISLTFFQVRLNPYPELQLHFPQYLNKANTYITEHKWLRNAPSVAYCLYLLGMVFLGLQS